jgi:hypothetical protein
VKFFILILLSNQVLANSFSLKDSSARFELKISKDQLIYESEQLHKTIFINHCNRSLAQKLNTEMLNLIPKMQPEKGIVYFVDDKKMILNSQSASHAMSQDEKMLNFFSAEKKLCQK